MAARRASQALNLIAGLLVCLPASLGAAESDTLALHGKALLQDKCARCHAVGSTGESSLTQAPPLRDIYARFSPRELQVRFSEGLASRHKDMPQIQFSDEDTNAILTYLYALAIRK